MDDDINFWHWAYHHFDYVDDGPRFIAEVLWTESILVFGIWACALVW